MFTGIIEAIGRVTAVQRRGDLLYLTIAPQAALTERVVGDSICVSGACLTVTALSHGGFEADCSSETQERTTLGSLKPHDEVNLERALKMSGRLGGHLVTGHVDATGYVGEVTKGSGSLTMTIRLPHELSPYVVEKGSVAVEGVSLTTSRIAGDEFQVAVIPYTAQNTTLGKRRVGDRVNIEVDLIGKYIKRFMQQGGAGIDKGFLAEHGFDYD
ncbi:MAG: riboflavin synthase [Deltaproteobacteria bacterium]|nr:riboflavin synthase [Deltaproteobacteria bacterium]